MVTPTIIMRSEMIVDGTILVKMLIDDYSRRGLVGSVLAY